MSVQSGHRPVGYGIRCGMKEREVKQSLANSQSESENAQGAAETQGERLALERDRLRLERQKLALELRFKRRELAAMRTKSIWKELLANPLTLAIAGGILTL